MGLFIRVLKYLMIGLVQRAIKFWWQLCGAEQPLGLSRHGTYDFGIQVMVAQPEFGRKSRLFELRTLSFGLANPIMS